METLGEEQRHCCICTEDLPPIGCSLPGTTCGRMLKQIHSRETWGSRTSQRFFWNFLELHDSLVCFHPICSFWASLRIRIASWCSPSLLWLPIFFHSGISANKVLAHLILAWHLLLRISRLIQAIQAPLAWPQGRIVKVGFKCQADVDLLTCRFSPSRGIQGLLF